MIIEIVPSTVTIDNKEYFKIKTTQSCLITSDKSSNASILHLEIFFWFKQTSFLYT